MSKGRELIPYVAPIATHEMGLSETERNWLHETERRIKLREEKVTRAAIEIGIDLLDAKIMLGHGNFQTWKSEVLGIEDRSAQRYMKLAIHFEKFVEAVSHLPVSLLHKVVEKSNWNSMKDHLIPLLTTDQLIPPDHVRSLLPAKKLTTADKRTGEDIKLKDTRLHPGSEMTIEQHLAIKETALHIRGSKDINMDVLLMMGSLELGEALKKLLLAN